MPANNLILFIDAQNFYRGARRAFFSDTDPCYCGQIKPIELGTLIRSRQLPHIQTSLHQVRVYTGRPDATKEPITYAAHTKQCAAWQRDGVKVIPRTLRYPPDWPTSKPQEKGIDVALAVDFVALAIDGQFDIGVIASTDTDLKPALEYTSRKCVGRCHVQVAAWTSPRTSSRLGISPGAIWCHWLNESDYNCIADLTNYNS